MSLRKNIPNLLSPYGPKPGPKIKLNPDVINNAVEHIKKYNLSNYMIAGTIGVSTTIVTYWYNSGEALQRQIERGEIESPDVIKDDYDRLCLEFFIRTREARAKLMANLTGNYMDLGKITAIDHVKEKILHKSMVSLDREKWSDSPQVQINQQFNTFGESDRVLGASIAYERIEGAVRETLPEATIEERRALTAKLRKQLTGKGYDTAKMADICDNADIEKISEQ